MNGSILILKTRTNVLAVIVVTAALSSAAYAATSKQISSPNGEVALRFSLSEDGVPSYTATFDHKPLVLDSDLGFTNGLGTGFQLLNTRTSQHRATWRQVYGERSSVPDNYRALTVELSSKTGQRMNIELRAYDEGVALRYVFPGGNDVSLGEEITEFHLPANSYVFEEHGTEGQYDRVPAGAITPDTERPLTVEFANGLFGSILEAATIEFPSMLLRAVSGKQDTLAVDLPGRAKIASLRATPWRVVLFGRRPGDLLEHDYLVLDLNAPSALKDTSWIKPGKAMREVTLSTEGARAVVDFAAAHNLQYILFDGGWYGSEDPKLGDATQARVNIRGDGRPNPSHPPLDLPWALQYAKSKSVGVFLYVDRRQIKTQRDILFPLYEKWGVKGVKIGFVDVGPQADTAWVNQTIREAAKYHLLLDIHDQFRPTGYTRTYPNLLTVEGIRGNEHFPSAQHDTTLPFTRYLSGSADYTICYYDGRLKNTHGHQLAMSVISYSPLQSVFWYDKPSAYHGEPEIKWFEQLPTVWDDTRVLDGQIGRFAIVARRSGSSWFVAVLNGDDTRTLKLDFSFLPKGKTFRAEVYSDDPSAPTRTHVRISAQEVTSGSAINLPLEASGGTAVHITPLP